MINEILKGDVKTLCDYAVASQGSEDEAKKYNNTLNACLIYFLELTANKVSVGLELPTNPKTTKRVRKSEAGIDDLLSWAENRGDGEYVKLTYVLSEDSFRRGGLLESVRSLNDIYDVIDCVVGHECAKEFGRLFID